MNRDRQILNLIEQIYEVALEPAAWPDCLEGFRQLFGGGVVTIWLGGSASASVIQVGMDPSFVRSYIDHYAALDPIGRAVAGLADGQLGSAADIGIDHATLARSEYYNDYMRPQGWLPGKSMGGVLLGDESGPLATFGFQAVKGDGRFGPRHLQLLKRLVPHLRRTARLNRRLRTLELSRISLFGVVDRMSDGVILVDGQARVIEVNAAADGILSDGDGLVVSHGVLRAMTPEATRELHRLIGATSTALGSQKLATREHMALPRSPGRHPLSLLIVPLPSTAFGRWQPRTTVAVLIADPERAPETEEEALRRVFGFTRAEARLAARMIHGRSPADISEELQVAMPTIRTQLKQLFAKTGTSRQAELTRVLLAALPRIQLADASSKG